ncbi:MAG: MerR family transcriptional regulator [Candidatus Eisenbacteria bacterium]|uniref:MerR family transcriptional regulator n=1 Tax=Eiseniibacteriota bacterium TaxID=2212470 RepID=A0A937XBX6_UNCEI|nr:MerR family transcriptional regulator [Candidatus Eisenbacteria bacterium]
MNEAPEKPYRSIREVSELLDIKPHVLRYWETQFAMLRPRKNRAGARMYQPKDIDLLREIRGLLHERGFTIAGARRKLAAERRGEGDEPGTAEVAVAAPSAAAAPLLREVRRELAEIAALLKAPPGGPAGRA